MVDLGYSLSLPTFLCCSLLELLFLFVADFGVIRSDVASLESDRLSISLRMSHSNYLGFNALCI
jgi:hypothetical protein